VSPILDSYVVNPDLNLTLASSFFSVHHHPQDDLCEFSLYIIELGYMENDLSRPNSVVGGACYIYLVKTLKFC
jgi:hypothetical protein